MFFKIVITILIVGIVAVLIWFLVDMFTNRDEEEERFHRNQFVLLDDIRAIHDSMAIPDVFIVNDELREIFFDNPEINRVYILFYSINFEDEFKQGIITEDAYDRYRAAWDKFDELLRLGSVVEDESERAGFIYFDSIAVFMLNVVTTGNEGWNDFLNEIRDQSLPVVQPWGPALLMIDLSDASPRFDVAFGQIPFVPNAIQEVIDYVTGAIYEEEDEEE